MTFSVSPGSFEGLAKEWQGLVDVSGQRKVFLTPLWQRTWWQEFSQGRKLALFSIHNDTRLIGIAPLMWEDKSLALIGSQDVCDFRDFVVLPGAEATFYKELLGKLETKEWRSLELPSLPHSSPTLVYFVPLAQSQGYQVDVAQEDVSPLLELPASWEEYLAALRKKDRHELRRKMRRLTQQADYRCYVASDSHRLIRDMADFLYLCRLSRPEKDEFLTEAREAFLRVLAHSLMEGGYLKLFFMEVDGARVAAAFCLDDGEELALYNSGYDPAYSWLSVGLLLKSYCIEQAVAWGRKRFNFLRGAEAYKYHLGGRDLPIYHCTVSRGDGG
ncbi:MAG: GNAT family N-acetyltransferase [Chloroflexi bacterium]|nr:GNAT family N-acetyltransferase [Chloroflexota bacterium]